MIKIRTQTPFQHSRTRPNGAPGDRAGTEMLLDEALSRTRQTVAE
jgi:hypothetical protein